MAVSQSALTDYQSTPNKQNKQTKQQQQQKKKKKERKKGKKKGKEYLCTHLQPDSMWHLDREPRGG